MDVWALARDTVYWMRVWSVRDGLRCDRMLETMASPSCARCRAGADLLSNVEAPTGPARAIRHADLAGMLARGRDFTVRYRHVLQLPD